MLPTEVYSERGVVFGGALGFNYSLLQDATGHEAYRYGKDLKADELLHTGPNALPSFSTFEGYSFKNGLVLLLTEDFSYVEILARFQGSYLLGDPDISYRRNFFTLCLSPGYKFNLGFVSIVYSLGGGYGYVLTRTKGYWNDTKKTAWRPLINSKVSLVIPEKSKFAINLGVKFHYIFDLPETNFFYLDGGNASFIGFDAGVMVML